MNKSSLKNHKWKYIFFATLFLCLLALILFLIWAVAKNGSLKEGILYLANSAFSDFGQVIYFTLSENPYTAEFSTMYTPINFLFYIPFAIICSANEAFYMLGTVTVDEYNYGIIQTWEFWVCLALYYVIVFTALFFLLKRSIPLEKFSDKVAFFLSLEFTTLIGFGFIRGSNIFIALVFFVAYINWYQSDVRWKRELSLLFFAVAGVMKYYVLFSGILLIKEKRWADVIKCVVYVFICMFLPFFFYASPIETIEIYISNLISFVGEEGRIGIMTNISVYNLVYCFFSLFGIENTILATVFCWIATICVFFLGIIICLKANNRFSELISMCCIFALVTPVAYLYMLCFMVLPFIIFEGEICNFEKKRKIFYCGAFFILMFIPLMVTRNFLIYTIVMLLILVVETINIFKRKDTAELSVYTDIVDK